MLSNSMNACQKADAKNCKKSQYSRRALVLEVVSLFSDPYRKIGGFRNFEVGEFGNSRRTEISRTHTNLAASAELRPNSMNPKRTEPNLSNSAQLCPIQPNSARTRRTEQTSARCSEFNRIHPNSYSAQLCLTSPSNANYDSWFASFDD